METFYITFGQRHIHRINNEVFDEDVVVEIQAEGEEDADNIAFDLFGYSWAYLYTTKDVEHDKDFFNYFPRGIIKL